MTRGRGITMRDRMEAPKRTVQHRVAQGSTGQGSTGEAVSTKQKKRWGTGRCEMVEGQAGSHEGCRDRWGGRGNEGGRRGGKEGRREQCKKGRRQDANGGGEGGTREIRCNRIADPKC